MTAKEQIVRLKCMAPEIEFLIEEADEFGAVDFMTKRLLQLAKKAKDKRDELRDSGVIQ
jgi:hypothetical protein